MSWDLRIRELKNHKKEVAKLSECVQSRHVIITLNCKNQNIFEHLSECAIQNPWMEKLHQMDNLFHSGMSQLQYNENYITFWSSFKAIQFFYFLFH